MVERGKEGERESQQLNRKGQPEPTLRYLGINFAWIVVNDRTYHESVKLIRNFLRNDINRLTLIKHISSVGNSIQGANETQVTFPQSAYSISHAVSFLFPSCQASSIFIKCLDARPLTVSMRDRIIQGTLVIAYKNLELTIPVRITGDGIVIRCDR